MSGRGSPVLQRPPSPFLRSLLPDPGEQACPLGLGHLALDSWPSRLEFDVLRVLKRPVHFSGTVSVTRQLQHLMTFDLLPLGSGFSCSSRLSFAPMSPWPDIHCPGPRHVQGSLGQVPLVQSSAPARFCHPVTRLDYTLVSPAHGTPRGGVRASPCLWSGTTLTRERAVRMLT